jgi:hypothetical protein
LWRSESHGNEIFGVEENKGGKQERKDARQHFRWLEILMFDFWYFVEEEEEEYDRRNKA